MRRGFTLIEVLVVLGISVLLSSVILTYSTSGRDQVYLGIEKAKVAQIISRAKSLSVSTYNEPDVPCGYGVLIDYDAQPRPKYKLFRYKVSPCANVQTFGISAGPGFSTDPEDEFTLPANLNFERGQGAIDVVFFMPPDPKTLIWEGDSLKNSGSIYLKTERETVQVKINSAGQITF